MGPYSHLVLAGDEVLGLGAVGRVDVTHPVGSAGVVAVDVVVQLISAIHLCRGRRGPRGCEAAVCCVEFGCRLGSGVY